MQTLLLIALFVLMFALLLSGFGSYILFGMIVRIEHDHHHAEWERDGRPFGFFERPDTGECLLNKPRYISKGMQSIGLSFLWMLRTPRWAADDPEAVRLLKWLRVCAIYGIAGWLVAFGLFLRVATEAKNSQIAN